MTDNHDDHDDDTGEGTDQATVDEVFALAEAMLQEASTRAQLPRPSTARLDHVAGLGADAPVYMWSMFQLWLEAACNVLRHAHPDLDATAGRYWDLGGQYLLPPDAGGNQRAIEIVRQLLTDHVETLQAPADVDIEHDAEVFRVFVDEVFHGTSDFRDTCVLQVMLLVRGALVEARKAGRL